MKLFKSKEAQVRAMLMAAVIAVVAIFFLLVLRVPGDSVVTYSLQPVPGKDGEVIITGCTGDPKKLEIPEDVGGDRVVSISAYAFAAKKNLRSVVIPGSVESIGQEAFYGCENLESVTLKEGVGMIGRSAFADCKYLRSVDVPDSLVYIDDFAFDGCIRLKKFRIPADCEFLGNEIFTGCESLTLDVSESPLGKSYALDYFLATNFEESGGKIYLIAGLLGLTALVLTLSVIAIVRKIVRKKDPQEEIRFVESELGRKERMKDGLVDEVKTGRHAARRFFKRK